MEKFFTNLKKIEEAIMVLLMIIMCVIIFVATVSRFTNLFIINWAEELARYCMIWIVFLGISVAAQNGEHFCVEALELFLRPKALKVFYIISACLVVSFNVIAAYLGMTMVSKQYFGGQITPSLNWSMWIIYLAIPLGLTLMAISYIYNTYHKIKHFELKRQNLQNEPEVN